jgi:Gpi18-like mannosyltransferase
LWQWLDKRGSYPILLACCLANLAFSYDTIFWGQVDGIVATLVFATMLAAWKRKVLVSGLCMVLAWNMKLQAGIFIPVWGLLMLPSVVNRSDRRQLMIMVPAMIALQLVLIAPFAYGPGGWKGVWQVVTGSLHNVPALSVNAYNWWYWTTSEYPGNVPDAGIAFMGLTYKQIGLLAFFTLSAFALYPLTNAVYANIRIKAHAFSEDDAKCIWLTSALVCMLFFFCNTEMHERYVHPAVLFLTAYAFRYKKYGMYAIFCVAYVLNLEGALHWLKLPNYGTVLFDGRVIAGLYAVVIVWLFVLLFQRKPLSAVQQAG